MQGVALLYRDLLLLDEFWHYVQQESHDCFSLILVVGSFLAKIQLDHLVKQFLTCLASGGRMLFLFWRSRSMLKILCSFLCISLGLVELGVCLLIADAS